MRLGSFGWAAIIYAVHDWISILVLFMLLATYALCQGLAHWRPGKKTRLAGRKRPKGVSGRKRK